MSEINIIEGLDDMDCRDEVLDLARAAWKAQRETPGTGPAYVIRENDLFSVADACDGPIYDELRENDPNAEYDLAFDIAYAVARWTEYDDV